MIRRLNQTARKTAIRPAIVDATGEQRARWLDAFTGFTLSLGSSSVSGKHKASSEHGYPRYLFPQRFVRHVPDSLPSGEGGRFAASLIESASARGIIRDKPGRFRRRRLAILPDRTAGTCVPRRIHGKLPRNSAKQWPHSISDRFGLELPRLAEQTEKASSYRGYAHRLPG